MIWIARVCYDVVLAMIEGVWHSHDDANQFFKHDVELGPLAGPLALPA